ncbi:alpha-L-fucosidase [Persicitalea jodogahamensis]|uniref:alpha-L-fucosidase n=1 Tax=Persicitalea jodogahamensis TaxID=402147 RepID=A0A8J3G8A9_9BACT|nr:alpha-L-fucosidase [Persicitalea jodogahamensis]GHB63584.1 alpha-L-fucosidase [Persicitalea jodogahamensis]
MKKLLLFIALSCTYVQADAQNKYQENWESIKANYKDPDWFRDAKLGIFIHWGVYAVPAHSSEWYPRNMYQDSIVLGGHGEKLQNKPSGVNLYHVKKYGPLNEFGYKDFIPDFKAEKFDPAAWISLFKDAGAKYIVPVAEHHDAFAMYNSSITPWNSVDMGPHRDVLGELRKETLKQGLKFGASSHLAFNWDFFNKKPSFNNMAPKYALLYGPNHEPYAPASEDFRNYWWSRTKEIIDNYQPDVLWFDFGFDRPEYAPQHLKLAAYYYNKGEEWNKRVVLQSKNLKYESFPLGTNVLDIERSKLNEIRELPWQTDTSVGANSWGYVENWKSKNPNTIVDDLVDIVSKNGNLLLNVGPKADGTIPDDQKNVLLELGKWLEVNGEAIYGTRPYKIYGEGPTKIVEGHLSEDKNKDLGAEDIRYTQQKDGQLYATIMDWPKENKTTIHTLAKGNNLLGKVSSVSLLGYDGKLKFKQAKDGLEITLPDAPVGKYAYVFKIN